MFQVKPAHWIQFVKYLITNKGKKSFEVFIFKTAQL